MTRPVMRGAGVQARGQWGGGGRREGDDVLEGGASGRGGGRSPQPHPQTNPPPWLVKALGPSSAAARKARMVPWSA